MPDPVVGDQVMAALVLAPGAEFDAEEFREFLAEAEVGPGAQAMAVHHVRVSAGAALPRTVTFKVLKRELSASRGVDCTDPVWPIRR